MHSVISKWDEYVLFIQQCISFTTTPFIRVLILFKKGILYFTKILFKLLL